MIASVKRERVKEYFQIYSLLAPIVILLFIFCYIPMYGIVIAFQDYIPGSPFIGPGVTWVGFKYIIQFVKSAYFGRILRNSLVLSGLNLLFGFTVPIFFALLLDQVRHLGYRRLVQTASYMPYFISMVVVGGMVRSFLDTNGIITNILVAFGAERMDYILNKQAFPWVYTVTNIWKSFGFGSILYFATIASIDPQLYESAKIDGANRLQQCWYITLPGIQRIIAINLIMAIGGILGTNSDLILLIYHPATYETADVIGTYVYRVGIVGGDYSYSAATGLFMSLIGFVLTYTANRVSNRLTDFGLW
jgi:putative aldouronate transport system permease protein